MSKELSKAYNPKIVEEKISQLWEKSGFSNPDKLPKNKAAGAKNKRYTIHLPPPNVTGSLHMGHALNATIIDILIRYHRMKGYETLWLPGIDHAGIATQNVVEKQLKKEGLTRWKLGREKFIERIWQWKEKYGSVILGQLKKLGASCDWSRTRFTMDPEYAKWVMKTFIHYHKKGLIYRGKRVVSWCPRCQTSLSDLEIEYKPEKTSLWYIRYPLANGKLKKQGKQKMVIVATTRPETMLGDAAVAVNPKDKRYKGLTGQKVILPIQNREIPIIADPKIDMQFGTGAVKITPAHDLLDAEIAERHGLPFHQIIDERGGMTAEAGKICLGLKTRDCREQVVAELKRLDLIEKIEDYEHNLAACYRCGAPLEPNLSNQWFLKMGELAQKALTAVRSNKVQIIPKNFGKPYLAWLENIKDWTISRQIWWGHQLPVWFCKNQIEEKFVVALKKPTSCPFCQSCEMERSQDVLDTWFSSALWPFAGLSEGDIKRFYPSNVLITARDIINLWVARMIFSGLEFMGAEPFPEVLIHATILTKEGKRMSKSLGTGIDPLELIEKYGTDATRFGIIWQVMGDQDIRWDETAVMAGKKFANKLWNISRFILGQENILNPRFAVTSKDFETRLQREDRAILKKLENVRGLVEQNLARYQFGRALHEIYDFTWHEFADKYIESSKGRADEISREVLHHILLSILKMLHPFMPFITEEIYQLLPQKKDSPLMIAPW